jgi:hypothetical protein
MRGITIGIVIGAGIGLLLGIALSIWGTPSSGDPISATDPDWNYGGIATLYRRGQSPLVLLPFLGAVFGFFWVYVRRNWQW